MNSTTPNSDESTHKKSFLSRMLRPSILIPLILLVACVGVYFYKDFQVKNAVEKASEEKQLLIEKSQNLLTMNSEYFLKLLSTPFSWALRTAMLNGNMEQVNQYLYEFVKNKNFELIVIADPSGKIISSTDKKLEGTDFGQHFESTYLSVDSVAVYNSGNGKLVVVSPVMGFNSKLGTMLSVYVSEVIESSMYEQKSAPKIPASDL